MCQGDAESVCGIPSQGSPSTGVLPVTDFRDRRTATPECSGGELSRIFPSDILDESVIVVTVRIDPQGELILNEREIDDALNVVVAARPMFHEAVRTGGPCFQNIHLRLDRDDA